MLSESYVDDLRSVGAAAGLERLGVTTADPLVATRVVLEERKAAGLHGGMQFTYRNPARSTEPERALASARTLVVGAHRYPTTLPDVPSGQDGVGGSGPFARVARYATGDHYGALRSGLEAVAGRLRADGFATLVVLDDNALVDRAAAARAGLGWFGKNANLLLAGSGSWCVLGSVLTDAPLPPNEEPVADGCGACTRCIDGCPTAAIVAPGVVDARRCLAWLVQCEGVFPLEHRVALDDRLYGCDTCQEVCPPSTRSVRGEAPPASAAPVAAWVDTVELLGATDEELLASFGRWYIPKREPRYLRRNALIVLGNAAELPLSPAVEAVLRRALRDPDPIVRGHAVWAARRLGADHLVVGEPSLSTDRDPIIVAELAADVVPRAGSSR